MRRIADLAASGPAQFVFTLNTEFQAEEQFQPTIEWSAFEPRVAL